MTGREGEGGLEWDEREKDTQALKNVTKSSGVPPQVVHLTVGTRCS